nr:Mur ligase family protein [Rhodohalobacter sp. SW132]
MFGRSGASAANFSLDSIRDFCEKIGNPHLSTPCIHVAGTNGKGTTCRILASVYQSAGYKTGLFTSPHLVEYRERISVDAQMIPDAKLVEFFQRHETELETHSLTYFELSAVIAFWYFSDQEVDIAIYETGLGGRLDATNIVKPLVSLVTSISLDHTDILGNTIAQIAAEKAGIIKPGRPVVTGNLPAEADQVIESIAEKVKSEWIKAAQIPEYHTMITGSGDAARPFLLSEKLNLPIVYSVVRCLSEQYPVSLLSLQDGLDEWQKRYPDGASFRQLHPDLQWYYDGAHNTDSLSLLIRQLKEIAPLDQWTFVLAMMSDKLNSKTASLVSKTGSLYYYPINSERAAGEEQYQKYFKYATKLPVKDEDLETGWIVNKKTELVIFGGSFYFYQTVRRWMGNIIAQ